MLSRGERITWSAVLAVAVAGAVAAWWTADQWLPQAGPWAEQAWRRITRPGTDTLPAERRKQAADAPRPGASAPAVQARKCVHNGRTTYTDQAHCPPGSQELPLDGGAVTSLPARP